MTMKNNYPNDDGIPLEIWKIFVIIKEEWEFLWIDLIEYWEENGYRRSNIHKQKKSKRS
jgi:hypothetical protein